MVHTWTTCEEKYFKYINYNLELNKNPFIYHIYKSPLPKPFQAFPHLYIS